MEDKKSSEWTQEERDRVVGCFRILIEMDKKQNPDLYKSNTLEIEDN